MKEKTVEIDGTIARLLSGESGWEDMLALNEWLAENPQNKSEFVALGKYWNSRPVETGNATASFAEAKGKIFSGRKVRGTFSGSGVSRRWVPAVAAFALLLAAASFAAFRTGAKEYNYVAGDSIGKFSLPDGSRVTLNKGTTLTYSESVLGRNRYASLSGEAYFDVFHDSRHPFCVQAGEARVKVLGTRFNVKLCEDGTVTTALEEGCVQFNCGRVSETLRPGESLTYSFPDGSIAKTTGDVERLIAWKDGIFRYRSKPLSLIAEEISANYGCNVLIDSQLKDILMSGAFFSDQPLEDVLRILQSCLNVNWVINDNTVYLSSK